MELGWRFWAWVLGVTLAVAVGGFLVFALIGWAWYAWGLFGMFIVLGGALLAFAAIWDRRQAKKYERLSREVSAER
jgi:hypothetical protein